MTLRHRRFVAVVVLLGALAQACLFAHDGYCNLPGGCGAVTPARDASPDTASDAADTGPG